ncbi:MAG: CotH kinase family protein [Saprospiraceae bacterium]
MNKYIPIFFLLIFWQIGLTQSPTTSRTKIKPKKLYLEFSKDAGFYEHEIRLHLHSPGARVFYTLDGTEPSYQSPEYAGPIVLEETTVVRAIARKGKRKSKLKTKTYFIDEPKSTLPTISIAVPPAVLFDPELGLYVNGPNVVDSLWKKDGANFWSRREVEINTELFELDGKSEFNSRTGFRLFGGMSRLFPQKSMTIVARKRYGKKKIKHKVFGKEGLKNYKFMVLRNSGSDWGKTHFRDAFMVSLLDDWDLEKQDSRPTHVYLNGEYWGIYNIREKVNRHFISSHHELDKDSIDLLEHQYTTKRGSRQHYLQMLRYIENNDMSQPAHYEYIKTQMDVENFMQYQIAQIYYDNRDAGGNIKFWRPQTKNGKWRWILYDTDWGFGLHDKKAYKFNSLAFHTKPDGPSWPNPPWSTLILRSLLENEEFKNDFLNRFADEINTTWATERVEKKIDEFFALYEPEIDRQIDRWNLSKKLWKSEIYQMRVFGRKRPDYVRMHLMGAFDTGGLSELSVVTTPGGKVVINNNINITSDPFAGQYFKNIPINIKAIPNYGYRFVGWEGIPVEDGIFEANLLLRKKATNITAIFEPYIHPMAGKVIINEISANNKKSKDWVELYNNSEAPISLSGWNFTDTKHFYELPRVQIPAKEYLVLTEDLLSFSKRFPEVYSVAGDFPFGLNKRMESVGLYASDGALIDSIAYELPPTDSTFTISLLMPHLDNGDIENWEFIKGEGTPNAPNPYYLESHIQAQQDLWIRIGVGLGVLLLCFLVLRTRNW